jgi:hypothetical protein
LPAVTARSVWFGGYRAGILTAVLGYVAVRLPLHRGVGFGPYQPIDLIRLIAVALSTTIIIVFGEGARSSPPSRSGHAGRSETKIHEQFHRLADSAPVLDLDERLRQEMHVVQPAVAGVRRPSDGARDR